jgi:anhydro-N-acetylmuramic acid kinase
MKQPSGNKKEYLVIGLMSGTSLDGLDLAACRFTLHKGKWEYSIRHTETVDYPAEWKNKLATAHQLNGAELTHLDRIYGTWLGEAVGAFTQKHQINPDLIASHGHTVYHRPDRGYTLQIGHGGHLAAASGYQTIADFRSTDVALGGQGAPLVPVGDRLLFAEYDVCLNLGGFANISMEEEGARMAGDICPVNIILNRLAEKKGLEYDHGGESGRTGKLNKALLEALNQLIFYAEPLPRSLGREWVEEKVMPLLHHFPDTVENHLCTFYEHIAVQISGYLKDEIRVLVTGGGAFNEYLLEKIRQKSTSMIIIPDIQLVKYKEALIFAFLGLLRFRNEVNCLKSVTGASRNSSSGALYML